MRDVMQVILLIVLSFFLFTCSRGKPDDSETLAEINDYRLTLREFQVKLANELEMDREFKLTREARKEFLDDIIKNGKLQLLITIFSIL